MVLDTKRVVIELDYREIIPVERAVGARIHCIHGRIWVTEPGSADDIVLEPGESHEISRSGITIVQALRQALVAVRPREAPRTAAANTARVGRLWGHRTPPTAGGHPAIDAARG